MIDHETIRVLLVEDDVDTYRLMARLLEKQRCQFIVTWKESMTAAIEELGRRSFDIILTDLSLPDSVGLKTVSQLRHLCGRTPIIVITSLEDASLESNILAAGAQDYLVKGEFRGHALTRAILHAVQRQQSLNEANALVSELQQSKDLLARQARLLKKKNRRLRKLYQTAQEFVDNVSHDFRTPLTVIKDYVSIIREGLAGEVNGDQQTMLDKVSVRADDLNNMVDDLLDVSKLESGLAGAWRRNVQVAQVIDRTDSLLQQRANVRNVELVIDCPANLPDVYCDAEKVGRVITNLAVNAIKFSGEAGRVRLWAEADPAGHQVIIGITDNGPGIDPQSLAAIFERFEQLNRNTPQSVTGFGLGLNIAQRLCQLNLGELSVQSRLGEGSTFSFNLPIADPVEVLRRWLGIQKKKMSPLQLVEITLEGEASGNASHEFECFLNCLLRSGDLLTQVDPTRWLLVMSVSPLESEKWFNRARKEYERHNRNRPAGAMPTYRAEIRSQWDRRNSLAQILMDFERFANPPATLTVPAS